MNFKKELYDKYPIEHYEIHTGGVVLHQFYSTEYKLDDILFIYNENNNSYEPKAYDYWYDEENDTHNGIEIEDGDIIFEFVRAVKNVLKRTNVKENKIEEGSYFIYQWVSSIHILLEAKKYNSKFHDLERSRQTGKSFELGFLSVFLFVFGKMYFESENEKFWVILCSYRDTDGVDKIFEEAHFYLKDMMELYNKIYPDRTIFTGKYTLKDKSYYAVDKVSSCKTEINIIIDGEVRPYSIMLGLTTKVKQDGLSMDFGWLDEGFATPFEEFDRSIDAFRASTGSNLVVSGISSVDSANMQYFVHHMESSVKTKLIYPVAYNIMKLTHPSRAEKMRGYVESKISTLGFDSTNVQTNYFLNWETLDGKFYTKKLMEKNKNYGQLTDVKDGLYSYRVAGLDLSTSHDYTVLTVLDAYEDIEEVYNENKNTYEKIKRWRYELRAIETYNIDKKKMSSEKVAEDTAKYCNKYEVDMLVCDGTGTQETYVEWILKKINMLSVNTFVLDYNFSGQANKVYMMSHLEDCLFSQRLKLGSKKDLLDNWSWKKLFEEMMYLIRENKKDKNNIQWYAPKSKSYTDDHVMSLALGCYCIPYINKLIKKNKKIEIGTYKYRARLNKFTKQEQEDEYEMPKTYMRVL